MARKREDPPQRMPEPDVQGLRHLPPDEQELMELGRSEEGEEIGE